MSAVEVPYDTPGEWATVDMPPDAGLAAADAAFLNANGERIARIFGWSVIRTDGNVTGFLIPEGGLQPPPHPYA